MASLAETPSTQRQGMVPSLRRVMVHNFGTYVGVALHLPEDAVLPEEKFLAEHHSKIFQKT